MNVPLAVPRPVRAASFGAPNTAITVSRRLDLPQVETNARANPHPGNSLHYNYNCNNINYNDTHLYGHQHHSFQLRSNSRLSWDGQDPESDRGAPPPAYTTLTGIVSHHSQQHSASSFNTITSTSTVSSTPSTSSDSTLIASTATTSVGSHTRSLHLRTVNKDTTPRSPPQYTASSPCSPSPSPSPSPDYPQLLDIRMSTVTAPPFVSPHIMRRISAESKSSSESDNPSMRHSLVLTNLKDGTLPPTDIDLERELENLDLSDDRIDPDGIVHRRLTRIGHNELLMRQARASGVMSVFSFDGESDVPPLPKIVRSQEGEEKKEGSSMSRFEERDSTYTSASGYTIEAESVCEDSPTRTNLTSINQRQNKDQAQKRSEDNELVRASVQTYESSVLTYGSMSMRASRVLSETDGETSGLQSEEEEERLRLGRPRAPLPWAPRSSALERIVGSQNTTTTHPTSSSSLSGIPTMASITASTSLSETSRPRAMSMNTGLNTGINAGTGRRPLPPLPTPVSATFSTTNESRYSGVPSVRDSVSLSLPGEGVSRSVSNASTASKYSVASTGSMETGSQAQAQAHLFGGRRIRPLPRTPSGSLGLPGIAEQSSQPEERAPRVTSMILSPTTGETPASGRRRSRVYSTLGYGYGDGSSAKVRGGIMNMFSTPDVTSPISVSNDEEKENENVKDSSEMRLPGRKLSVLSGRSKNRRSMRSIRSSRALSIRSTRSARSSRSMRSTTYFVPDVDELVRILDAMDPGFESSGDSGEEAGWVDLDMDLDLDDIDFKIGGPVTPTKKRKTEVTGLPTPAATPRASPRKKADGLPANNSTTTGPSAQTSTMKDVVDVNRFADEDVVRSEDVSPAPSSAGAFSLGNFPLPPVASISGVAFPSLTSATTNENAIPAHPTPNMNFNKNENAHERTLHEIADLKNRVSGLLPAFAPTMMKRKMPTDVPVLQQPVPPRRRRSQSHTLHSFGLNNLRASPENQTTPVQRRQLPRRPGMAIDVTAANAIPSHMSSNLFGNTSRVGVSVGGSASGASSAPPVGEVRVEQPTVIYATPTPTMVRPAVPIVVPEVSVAPLKIRRSSALSKTGSILGGVKVDVPPPANVPQSASALQTKFAPGVQDLKDSRNGFVAPRAQRSASFCVSPGSNLRTSPLEQPLVQPLRFRNSKLPGARPRGSTLGDMSLREHLGSGLSVSAPVTVQVPQPLSAISKSSIQVTPIERQESRTSMDTNATEDSDAELVTPTNGVPPPSSLSSYSTIEGTPIALSKAGIVTGDEYEPGCGTGLSMISVGSSFSELERQHEMNMRTAGLNGSGSGNMSMDGCSSLDPAFADIIKSISGASEEEQMGSLLTLASSINTEHHTSGYNAGFAPSSAFAKFFPMDDEDTEFVDIDENVDTSGMKRREGREKGRRKSRSRSIVSSASGTVKRRQSAAVKAVIRSLPDPSTFPIPPSAGSVATDVSASAAGADYTAFGFGGVKPSSMNKLKVVTNFKGGSVLMPASQAPLSAVSTKSTMSTMSTLGAGFGGSNSNSSGRVSKRGSTASGVGYGPRKMNRLTLTDPRSPMADAAVAAATLVARVRQKRAALAQRGVVLGASSSSGIQNGNGEKSGGEARVIRLNGHRRTGSNSSGTLRSKLKMSGSGFFGR